MINPLEILNIYGNEKIMTKDKRKLEQIKILMENLKNSIQTIEI